MILSKFHFPNFPTSKIGKIHVGFQVTWTYNWKLSPGPSERSSSVDFMPMVPGTFKRHCFFFSCWWAYRDVRSGGSRRLVLNEMINMAFLSGQVFKVYEHFEQLLVMYKIGVRHFALFIHVLSPTSSRKNW